MDIEQVEMQRITVKADERLVFSVDVGKMPKHRAESYMKDILDMMKKEFETDRILVVPKGIEITAVKIEDDDK